MKLFVATKDAEGRWQKAAILKTTAEGRLTGIPVKHQGTLESALGQQAGRFFAAEKAARTVFYAVLGHKYRVDRVI